MATSFFVVMQKRGDGSVYADLHKTNEKIYFAKEDAEKALNDPDGDYSTIREFFHVVELVAETLDDWQKLVAAEDQAEKAKKAMLDIVRTYMENTPELLLQAGEMTSQELRTVKAVLGLCFRKMEKV